MRLALVCTPHNVDSKAPLQQVHIFRFNPLLVFVFVKWLSNNHRAPPSDHPFPPVCLWYSLLWDRSHRAYRDCLPTTCHTTSSQPIDFTTHTLTSFHRVDVASFSADLNLLLSTDCPIQGYSLDNQCKSTYHQSCIFLSHTARRLSHLMSGTRFTYNEI